jgi:hypothetical protein
MDLTDAETLFLYDAGGEGCGSSEVHSSPRLISTDSIRTKACRNEGSTCLCDVSRKGGEDSQYWRVAGHTSQSLLSPVFQLVMYEV